jgi:hypothetical protein
MWLDANKIEIPRNCEGSIVRGTLIHGERLIANGDFERGRYQDGAHRISNEWQAQEHGNSYGMRCTPGMEPCPKWLVNDNRLRQKFDIHRPPLRDSERQIIDDLRFEKWPWPIASRECRSEND